MTVFTRGAVTIQQSPSDQAVVVISVGADLTDPETDVVGCISSELIDDLIAALKLYKG